MTLFGGLIRIRLFQSTYSKYWTQLLQINDMWYFKFSASYPSVYRHYVHALSTHLLYGSNIHGDRRIGLLYRLQYSTIGSNLSSLKGSTCVCYETLKKITEFWSDKVWTRRLKGLRNRPTLKFYTYFSLKTKNYYLVKKIFLYLENILIPLL